MNRRLSVGVAGRSGLLLTAFLLPLILNQTSTGQYTLNTLVLTLFYAYVATGWNILGGMAGQHSLGHSIFLGVGAYTSTLLFLSYGLSPWIGMLVGMVLASVLALVIGGAAFRWGLKGAYFALVTIALAEAARTLASNLGVIGGASGLEIPLPRSTDLSVLVFHFDGPLPYYYIALIMTLVAVGLTIWMRRRALGFHLVAVRENEAAAEALGVDVWQTKVVAYMISAAITAGGGTFLAQYVGYIHPGSVFGEGPSVQILLFAIVGGLGTTWGPALGALLLVPLAEAARSSLSNSFAGADLAFYGAVLVITMLFLPRGMVGLGASVTAAIRGRMPTRPRPPRSIEGS